MVLSGSLEGELATLRASTGTVNKLTPTLPLSWSCSQYRDLSDGCVIVLLSITSLCYLYHLTILFKNHIYDIRNTEIQINIFLSIQKSVK